MPVTGADKLDQALAAVAADATDRNVHALAGELVLVKAKAGAKSRRVASSGRVAATDKRAQVIFGSNRVRFAAPEHFGHGTRANPRAQGGWMDPPNPYLWRGSDQAREQVIDLYLTRTIKAIDRHF